MADTTTSSTSSSSSAASTASSILSTLGVGSGIDTGSLITKLVSATYDPKLAAQTAAETANTSKISTLASLSSDIDSFSTALNTLISGGTLRTQPNSSDTSILTVSAQAGAQLGSLSAQLAVKQVAKAQSLVSGYSTSANTALGSGTITLTVAGKAYPAITLDSSNNTLAGIASAINQQKSGLTATVVTDANGARLQIKGATGAANSFSIAVDGSSDTGVQGLAWPQSSSGVGMTQAQAAQDAIVTMDGVDVARASNTITDLIPGVNLTLVKESPSTTITLGATRPTDAITSAVSDFVSAYNTLKAEIDAATAAASGSTAAGAFNGNSSIRSMQTQLSKLTATVLNTSGGPATLAEIGVATQKDGTLKVDSATLSKMLTNYPDGVEALFNPTQHSDSPLIKITSAMGAAKPGTYTLTNIVPATDSTSVSGRIGNLQGQPNADGTLSASSVADAAGLTILPSGSVTSATITVDSGIGGALQAIRDALRATGGLLDSMNTTLTKNTTTLSDARTKLTTDEDNYKTRLTTQFTAMDTAVSAYKSTQSYLTQQIANWSKSG